MYWNRFDIVEAYYLYFCENHSGQFSPEYRRLCKMQKYFTPSPLFRWDSLSENAREIYLAIRILKQEDNSSGLKHLDNYWEE